jgi:peptidoglycan/xylan/chitin deacetylase (PgdA/CDA1 family)
LHSPNGRPGSLRRARDSKYLILCYHRVGLEGIPYYSTLPVSQFEMQMLYLRKHYRVLSLAEIVDELADPPEKATQAVAVTFDDGYSDLYRYALPILREYQIPATIYLIANCIESGEVPWYDRVFLALQLASETVELGVAGIAPVKPGSAERIETAARVIAELRRMPVSERQEFCRQLERQIPLPPDQLRGRMLNWGQVFEMRKAGVAFGAHTLSHPALSQLSSGEISYELRESRRILEASLGDPVLDFAFPFGKPEDCGALAYEAARQVGFRSAATTTWGFNSPGANLHALRRVQIGEQTTAAGFGLEIVKTFAQAQNGLPIATPGSEDFCGSPAVAEVMARSAEG